MKKRLICIVICSIMIVSSIATAFAAEETADYVAGEYITTPNLLNFREDADSKSEIIATISSSTKLEITKIKDDWGFTEYGGKSGWVMMEYLKYTGGEYITTPELLNFREDADVNSDKITTIPLGTKLAITKLKGEWGFTEYGGESGWVMMEYLEYVGYLDAYKVDWKVIDVSYYQGTIIDWNAVKSDGVKAVILRIGRRATSSRTIDADTSFTAFYDGAKAAGLYVGAYFYSAAYSVNEAIEEAEWVIKKIKDERLSFNMPVFFDIEYTKQEELGKEVCTDMVKAFCDTLIEKGVYSGVYCNQWWASELLDMTQLVDYPVWLANYSGKCDYAGRYNMWQKTNTGSVSGISGNVDINECYTNFPQMMTDLGYIQEKIDEHVAGEWIIDKEATCTAYGERVLECTHCDVDLEIELIDKTNHVPGEWTVALEPTAIKDGERVQKCVDCDLILNKQCITATAGEHTHTYSAWIEITPAACSSHGATHRICTDCGQVLEYSILDRINHVESEGELFKATCTEAGKTVVKCADCGETLKYKYIDPLGHNVVTWEITKEVTSNEKGERTGKCTVCGETVIEEIEISKEITLGDLNADGKITVSEARRILRHAVSIEYLKDEELLAADMNGDGEIKTNDARLALRKAVNID